MKPVKILVFGLGYLGQATVIALLGNKHASESSERMRIIGIDPLGWQNRGMGDERGIELRIGWVPGLAAHHDLHSLGNDADFAFICVGTPSCEDSSVDVTAVEAAVAAAKPMLKPDGLIVIRSTVPPWCFDCMKSHEGGNANGQRVQGPLFSGPEIVAMPEFLREATALQDAIKPDRVIIGAKSNEACNTVLRLFWPEGHPATFCDAYTAMAAKYACNFMLALKVAGVNEMADLFKAADWQTIQRMMDMDSRLGRGHSTPGIGFGGYCLPKDTAALANAGSEHADFILQVNEWTLGDARREIEGAPTAGFLWFVKPKQRLSRMYDLHESILNTPADWFDAPPNQEDASELARVEITEEGMKQVIVVVENEAALKGWKNPGCKVYACWGPKRWIA